MPSAEIVGALLALGSAVAWGSGDFAGGVAAKRAPVLRVVLLSNLLGTLLLTTVAVALREPMPSADAILYAVLSGVGASVGLASLYHALSLGRMGAVAPAAAVVTALVPAIAGAVAQGLPSPIVFAGFALALGGVFLVSGPEPSERKPLLFALLAGLGFGSFLVLIHAAAGAGSSFGPLAISRATALLLLAALLAARRETPRVPKRAVGLAALAMLGDVGGNVLFLAASTLGRLDVAGVLSSLYPAATVALAYVVLRERLTRLQALGVAALLVAIVLVVLG